MINGGSTSESEASISRLSQDSSNGHRVEFYRRLKSGRLFLVTREPADAPALNVPVRLSKETIVGLLTVPDPQAPAVHWQRSPLRNTPRALSE
jgi:hypothetical protein